MSTHSHISRYLLILNKLKAKPYTSFEVIQQYIESQYEYMQLEDERLSVGSSKRTFQRTLKEIRELFNVDIQYSRSEKGYYIANSDYENMNFQRMLEAFDVFNSLNLAKDLSPYLHLEKRQPQGTENLYGLLHAIKNGLQISFEHKKLWDELPTDRTVEPYALKEYRSRWYLLAKDLKDGAIKSFALDRISSLLISDIRFKQVNVLNIEAHYKYSFGIISPNDLKPQEIELSFTAIQGKYIRSLPLHSSQEIILDNDEELRIRLILCLTHDFLMELLSFGDEVKVIKPRALILQIKQAHEKAFKQYL